MALGNRVETRTKRGAIGRSWWSKELISTMEQVADKARLTRGRAYARSGQVVSMRIEPGAAVGEVQGSQLRPFTSTVTVRRLDDDAIDELIAAIRACGAGAGRAGKHRLYHPFWSKISAAASVMAASCSAECPRITWQTVSV